MVEAVVEYDYTAQEPDELTIRKGDVIREIIKKAGGWWEGTLRDKRGMFPDNFVSVIQKEKVSLRQKPNRIRQCRAIFSYHPAHDDELSLSVGDVIDIVCEVEEGWWKGRLGNHEGVFPSNFVAEMDASKSQSRNSSKEDLTSLAGENDTSTPNLPPKPTKLLCQVKYPYDACNEDELTLREGDYITLISKDGQDRGWWRGELRGRVGVFPDNFVMMLPANSIDQNGPQAQHNKQDKIPDQKSSNKSSLSLQNKSGDEVTPKPVKVASQRKSLELKPDDHKAPPLPGKKPSVPKKSPSSASSSGVPAGIKQKMIDKVDGAASSRAANLSPQPKQDDEDCDFDQVERSAMLPDMRANRAKAPGRRPPSTTYRDADNGLVNGNSEHVQPTSLSEASNDEDDGERKPKAREWEKHKAPWVEELKLNQAKRTSTPCSADNSRLKLTPTTDKSVSPSSEADAKSPAPDKESSSPVDMTKSLSALSTKLKTPTSDVSSTSPTNVPLRMKPVTQPITTTPARPQSIHGVMVTNLSTTPPTNQSPSPASKPPVAEKVNIDTKMTAVGPRLSMEKKPEVVSAKQYQELLDRIAQMEVKMQQQFHDMQSTIEDLRGRLQVEGDMRRMLQAELEKVAQCVTQV